MCSIMSTDATVVTEHRKSSHHAVCQLTPTELEAEYKKKARESWDITWSMLCSSDWKVVAGDNMDTGLISCLHRGKLGKVFMVEGYVDASPCDAFKEVVIDIESSPSWNPTLIECRTLQVVDENTDISYNVAASAAGGLVSSRDFVNVRHWETRDGVILSAGCAVLHPSMPPCKGHVRGENKSCGWIFKPVPDNPNRCIFCWIFNSDLKGWIPHYIVEQAISGVLLQFLRHLREHCAGIRPSHPNLT